MRSPTSVGRPWPWDPGGRGVRCPSGVLTTTMRDAHLGVIAPMSRRYERACLDMGRGAPAGSLWRSGVTGAAFDGSLSCCCWGRLRRGLPCPSMVDCRRLTPRGARVVGALRRDFLSARFPDLWTDRALGARARGTARGGGDLGGRRCGSAAAPRLSLPLLMGSDSHEDDEEKTSGVEGPSSVRYSTDAWCDGRPGGTSKGANALVC